MAKLGCKCGKCLSNTTVPNDIEFWALSDHDLVNIEEKNEISTIELSERFTYNVWRCPECKRLYIFQGDDNSPKYVYKFEEKE